MSRALGLQVERARAFARELVERAPSDSIACIFAGGSLGRGEVWSAEIDGVLEVYSDVDLYVVARDDSRVDAIRAAATRAQHAVVAPAGTHFLRPLDIGVYTRTGLARQPRRPGTVDLRTHHLWLYGDRAIAQSLDAGGTSQVAGGEALYLLENRFRELAYALEREHPESAKRVMLVLALKARLDVYAAHAIVSRTFAPAHAGREASFAADPPATLTDHARQDVTTAFAAAHDLRAWMHGRAAGVEKVAALRAVADAWCALAPTVLAADVTVGELAARRCRAGARTANAREVFRLRRATGLPAGRAILAALRLSGRSPVASLRMHALVRELEQRGNDARAFGSHRTFIDALTRTFGFTDGSLDARVHAMHAAVS